MSGIKLTYFDGRGRAEVIRLLLVAAGQDFEDKRVTFDEWKQTEKPGAKFNALPNLTYKGKTYGQSLAIAQFVAREFGLYGKDNSEAGVVDQAIQFWVEIRTEIMTAKNEKDPARKEELTKKGKETIPPKLKYLEGLAADNGNKGFFVGTKLSLADVILFNAWDTFKEAIPEADSGNEYPGLKKIVQTVGQVPSIKKYLSNRKVTTF